MAAANDIVSQLRNQARNCRDLASPLTACLLDHIRADYLEGGVTSTVLAPWESRAGNLSQFALRITSALHYLVLAGRAPDLAGYFPTAGGEFRADGLWDAAAPLFRTDAALINSYLERPLQTNEIARAGTLLGGFLTIADNIKMPLRCLEAGASAGLLLNWDRYAYRLGAGRRWGDRESPVRINHWWKNGDAPRDAPVSVVDRRGCDIGPVDAASPDAQLRLKSYIWGDQITRFKGLDAALTMAVQHPVPIDREPAGSWAARQLAEQWPGAVTVLYTSLAARYFDAATGQEYEATIRRAARAATLDAPFAWMSLEAQLPGTAPVLRLSVWPWGTKRTLGHAHIHGVGTIWNSS